MEFANALAREIWETRYRGDDRTIEETWDRVATAAAAAEAPAERAAWRGRFRESLNGFQFLPAGRILAGAGQADASVFSCFVMGPIADAPHAQARALLESEATLRAGGGVGVDFSTLRPAAEGTGGGPLAALDRWDAMSRGLTKGGRRGAMMGCLRIDHPDVEAFIEAKRDPRRMRNFNLSVLVTDAFMDALEAGRDWPLSLSGTAARTIAAAELWERLTRAAYDVAEPGVIFVDRVNRTNNLAYCETISACNPCAEQMLPPYGACLLGSVNLAALVLRPYAPDAELDLARLEALAATAVRLLDDFIDLSAFPLPAQAREAALKRRIGLGVCGLADALILCGLRYGSEASLQAVRRWLGTLKEAAYAASAGLAREKGPFPLYDRILLDRPNLRTLAPSTRALIEAHGLRNGCLTSIAPTGTISLLAGGISSGIEPVFAPAYVRRVHHPGGEVHDHQVEDHALGLWRGRHDGHGAPEAFVTAQTLLPDDHLRVQAAAQAFIDSSISKTINCPATLPYAAFRDVYVKGWRLGCKSLTVFRPNPVTGAVLRVPGGDACAPGPA